MASVNQNQAAIYGTDYSQCKPVKLTVNAAGGATSSVALAPGAYEVYSTCNAWVSHDDSVTQPDGTQGTNGTVGEFAVYGGIPKVISLAVQTTVGVLSVDSGTGVLLITGPIFRGAFDS